jgi:hypothetical protein
MGLLWLSIHQRHWTCNSLTARKFVEPSKQQPEREHAVQWAPLATRTASLGDGPCDGKLKIAARKYHAASVVGASRTEHRGSESTATGPAAICGTGLNECPDSLEARDGCLVRAVADGVSAERVLARGRTTPCTAGTSAGECTRCCRQRFRRGSGWRHTVAPDAPLAVAAAPPKGPNVRRVAFLADRKIRNLFRTERCDTMPLCRSRR